MCAAPKGNQFWKLRSKHGRDKLFVTPQLLWEAACEYFEYCDKNPWRVTKSKKGVKGKETEETPTQCPYTLTGFLSYCDTSDSYWRKFKESANEDFFTVITRIENIIKSQQLEGAMVGAFNANIVARINGLAEKQELSGEVKTGLTVVVNNQEEADLLEQVKSH